ncbi:trypco2 family protein [Roseobacter sp. A03A-229]
MGVNFLRTVCISLGIFAGTVAHSQSDNAPVSAVIDAIKAEVQAASIDTLEPQLIIEFVDVVLTTITERSAGGGIDISVPVFSSLAQVEANAELSAKSTSSISLTLTPSEETSTSTAETLGLLEAIEQIKNGIREAVSNPPKMAVSSISYKTEFVLSRAADGKVKFFFATGEGGLSIEEASSITFHIGVAAR